MAEQKPSLNEELNALDQQQQEPFIPPRFLLILAGVGLLIAFIVAITQPTFTVVGWGGLVLAAVSIVLWALLSPDTLKEFLSGRSVRFGGVSIIVTIVVLLALAGIYTVARGQNIRIDLTQRNDFSLTDVSRQAIEALGADPTLPRIEIIAFYNASQAGRRDRDSALFDDYARTSGGKISYRFVDPDRELALAQQYNITRAGQVVVVALDENGQPDVANAELLNTATQDSLTNAILAAAAQGNFQAYFLTVEGNTAGEMGQIRTALTSRYDWKVEDASFVDLVSPGSGIVLNDPTADGQVLVLAGGQRPLADREIEILQNFVNNGGDLVIFADSSFNTDRVSLATADNFNAFLETNFGLRINNDVILDLRDAFQTPALPVATDFDRTSPVTTNGIRPGQGVMIFETPHSITFTETPPENVTVTSLIRSGPESFQVTDLQRVIDGDLNRRDGDLPGPFTLAASAENAATGSRVVVFGSATAGSDAFTVLGTDNLNVSFNALVWATDFIDFVDTITVVQEQRPQDTPIFADAQQTRTIQLITIYLLPFGILGLGVLVWWNNRERARAE
jgi:ABC-type uncharacterized transport system involved in gliding motility auxiliary subunit